MDAELERAIWEGNQDKLWELAACVCCCGEHTFEHCPARVWSGCRGQDSMTRDDEEAWVAHYAKHHGLTRDAFYGSVTP